MTPDQLARLLGGEWPPPTAHWPPKDKQAWTVGMRLVGVIETRLRLPRPDGSPRRGEPYTAVVVRRAGDGARVTYHGWRKADEDLDGMDLSPGLLFGVVYRGKVGDFEDFKHYSTHYDPAPAEQPSPERDPQGRTALMRQAQREASAIANGHDRPAPGTAARQAEPEGAYRDGVPTDDAIDALEAFPVDAQRLVIGAGQPFKIAVKQAGGRMAPSWGALWRSDDGDLWVRALLAARAEVGQPAGRG
jgi:hypothetical protein